MQHPDAARDALDEGRAFCLRDDGDVLRLTGADASDLLHRIAASDVRSLDATTNAPVILTDDKGRVVDVPTAWRGDAFVLLAGIRRGPLLRAWLEKWIIMEDARVEHDPLHTGIDLFGATALRRAAELVGVEVPPPGTVARGSGQLAVAVEGLGAARAHLLVPRTELEATREALLGGGPAGSGALTEIDDENVAAWCAERGIVRPGPGLEAGCHPLELGLKPWVSFTKGCYIGQEVVARLDTYDKVKRRVAVLHTDLRPAPGTDLRVDGRRAGLVLESGARAKAGGPAHAAIVVIDKSVAIGTQVELESGGTGAVAAIPDGFPR